MNRLRELRIEMELTQQDIADALKIHYSTYGKYELEQRNPAPEMLLKLADFFNVTTDYLLGRSNVRQFKEVITSHAKDTGKLPPEAIEELEQYKEFLRQKYKVKKIIP